MITQRTEQIFIKKGNPLWIVVDQNCLHSKNLYNYANYIIRQEFINNGKWIHFAELDKMLQDSDPYKDLKSQPSQQTLKVLDKAWKSFFRFHQRLEEKFMQISWPSKDS